MAQRFSYPRSGQLIDARSDSVVTNTERLATMAEDAIAVPRGIRIHYQSATRDYVARRTAEGKTSREIKRCLTRYVARDLYRLLETQPQLLDEA